MFRLPLHAAFLIGALFSGDITLKHTSLLNLRAYILLGIRHSSISIVTGYRLYDKGSISDRGKRFLSIPQRPNRLWVISSLLSNGYPRALSSGVKRLVCEAYHSPPSIVEVTNCAAITPLRHTPS
jgi:hypothetical protein